MELRTKIVFMGSFFSGCYMDANQFITSNLIFIENLLGASVTLLVLECVKLYVVPHVPRFFSFLKKSIDELKKYYKGSSR